MEGGLTVPTTDVISRNQDRALSSVIFGRLGRPEDLGVGSDGARPHNPPPNTLGLHRVMFAVDDIEDVVARLRTHGAELVGELAQYEDSYRLCYVRGPEGIIVALAEQLS